MYSSTLKSKSNININVTKKGSEKKYLFECNKPSLSFHR